MTVPCRTISLRDGEQAYLDSRMRDVERASERSRWFYIVTSLISLLLISVSYNQLASWSRLMAEGAEGRVFNEKNWPDQMVLLQMKEWVSGLQFDLPYLGGRFSASDAGIVGGMLLFVAVLWGYYALKRENHIVYFLIKDVSEFDFSDAARFYLRNQLYATQLFTGQHSRPFEGRNIVDTAYNAQSKKRSEQRQNAVLKLGTFLATNIVFFLPAGALSGVLAVDLLSLWSNSPFREGTEKLYQVLQANHLMHEVYLRLALSLTLLVLVAAITGRAFRYQLGTVDLIALSGQWKYPVIYDRGDPESLQKAWPKVREPAAPPTAPEPPGTPIP